MFLNPVPLSFSRHGGMRLKPARAYAHARAMTMVPVMAAELARVAQEMPVGFVRDGEGYALVALLGLEPGRNLFVGPDGRWLAGYVPARIRQYPFVLGGSAAGPTVVCVDESSGQLSKSEGRPLFEGDGSPSALVREVSRVLQEMERDRAATSRAAGALAGLMVPWEMALESRDDARRAGGLFRVDETALNALSDEGFLALRHAGALGMAYAHLLSLGRAAVLHRLAAAQARRAESRAPASPMPGAVDESGEFVFEF
ncbi:MAG: SapC family protein [Rhodospirillales bacterium]|nr:SapC family protein [Rhodospirillales bacterium]